MPSMKFPINVNLESTDGDVDRGKIVNGYAEVASAQEVKVYSRPALDLAQGSFAAFGQGVSLTPDGKLFVISGGNAYFPVPTYNPTAVSSALVLSTTGYTIAYGGSAYAFGSSTPFIVARAAPPFTSWTTLGTNVFNGQFVRHGVVHGNELTVLTGTRIYFSTNGTSWGTYGTGAGTVGKLYSLNSALRLYTSFGTAGVIYYNPNKSTAWGTGTLAGDATPGSPIADWQVGAHGGYGYIIHAEPAVSGVFRSADATNWVRVGTATTLPWEGTGGGPNDGERFASFGGQIILTVPVADSGTAVEIYVSPDSGVSWELSDTIAVTPQTISTAMVVDGQPYAVFPVDNRLRFYSLTSDGISLSDSGIDITPLDGEIVTIIGAESGTTFVKITTAAYTVDSNGAFTRVTDAQYPAVTVRGAVYLNGRLYVMEPDGTIWNSAEDDFTSWAGTDFVTAEFEADEGVALAKQGEYVIAFGQFTTEAFYDAGNATGSPLDPVGSAVMLIGCAHANSVAQVETSLVWVAQQKGQGSTFHKGRFVAFMQGYGAYDRISTPDVERVLDKDAFNEVYADILTIAGHVFYVLTLVDTDITLVYDFRSQLWYEWSLATVQSAKAVTSITGASALAEAILASHGYSDGDQVVVTGGTGTFTAANGTHNVNVVNSGTFTYPISSSFSGTCTTGTAQGWTQGALDISASVHFDNSQLVQLRETGDVYVLDVTGTSDNGAPIDFHIRTRLWDAETGREKFQNGLEVQGDKVASTGLVRYWDEDFTTPTKYRRVTLSLRRPRSKRGGSFSRRAVEFRHTLSAKVGISALEADIEMGEQ